MPNDQERLTAMFKANKISEDDYKILSAALTKKTMPINRVFSILVNPFQKIAGFSALALGLVVIVAMSYLGTTAGLHFPGAIDLSSIALATKAGIKFSFLLLVYQNLVSWLIVALIYLAIAIVLRQKRIRIVDFFGTVALSRFPFLLLVGLISIMRLIHPSSGAVIDTYNAALHPSIAAMIIFFSVNLCSVWQVITYFYALKESSGLTGKKLWIGFAVAIILAEFIASSVAMLPF